MEPCKKGARQNAQTIFCCFFFASCNQPVEAEPVEVKLPQQKMLSSPGGRFVFGQISDFRRDQFMLDTQTGRLWVKTVRTSPKNKDGTQPADDGIEFLSPVPYADGKGSLLGKNNNWNYTAPNN
ncbi:hypothetical protein [Candidatus Nitrotoga sp. 1052]|uniref:hypothetical protein n=1 Tax=Candidatus Nitrotoga sp. 1052 TaxID=2886964 RepID=UPI001EF4CC5B|nr:hypothetical protein [Candidatus Nitrotoga sp. 1052]CAH1092829.1 hypothetical protein NTG1052_970001 [Candidatus Nitrotoga sp. 1052]